MSRPLIVVMAGGTASGKSYLASAICARSDAQLITHDRYYLDVADPRGHNYDHPDALDTALLIQNVEQLRAGHAARLPIYDFATHSRQPGHVLMPPGSLIIVEGILTLAAAPLRALADLTVFVQTSDDIRLERRITRDMAKRGRTKESILEQYHSTVQPMHERFVAPSCVHADLLVSGTEDIDVLVRQVLKAIEQAR